MNRKDFIDHISGKDKTEISMEDCKEYYKHFHSIDENLTLKILGKETLKNMGEAMRIYIENAYIQFINLGHNKVQLPSGYYIISHFHNDVPLRQKWRELIPDGTSVSECKRIFKKIMEKI